MANPLYMPSGNPITLDTAHSKAIRDEFKLIEKGFDLLETDINAIEMSVSFALAYQGAADTAPIRRRNGRALEAGDLYFSTAHTSMMVYTGRRWQTVPTDLSAHVSKDMLTQLATTEAAAMDKAVKAAFAAEADEMRAAVAAEAAIRARFDNQPTALHGEYIPFTSALSSTSGITEESITEGWYYQLGSMVMFSLTLDVTGSRLKNDLFIVRASVPFRPIEPQFVDGFITSVPNAKFYLDSHGDVGLYCYDASNPTLTLPLWGQKLHSLPRPKIFITGLIPVLP